MFDIIKVVGQILTGVALFVFVPLPVSARVFCLQGGHKGRVLSRAGIQCEEVLYVRGVLCEVRVSTHARMGEYTCNNQ